MEGNYYGTILGISIFKTTRILNYPDEASQLPGYAYAVDDGFLYGLGR